MRKNIKQLNFIIEKDKSRIRSNIPSTILKINNDCCDNNFNINANAIVPRVCILALVSRLSKNKKNIYKFMLFTTNFFVANLLKHLRSCQFTSMKRQLSKPVITFLLIALQPRLYAYKREAKGHHSSKGHESDKRSS